MANAFFSTIGVVLGLFVCATIIVGLGAWLARGDYATKPRKRKKRRKPVQPKVGQVLRLAPDHRRFMPPEQR